MLHPEGILSGRASSYGRWAPVRLEARNSDAAGKKKPKSSLILRDLKNYGALSAWCFLFGLYLFLSKEFQSKTYKYRRNPCPRSLLQFSAKWLSCLLSCESSSWSGSSCPEKRGNVGHVSMENIPHNHSQGTNRNSISISLDTAQYLGWKGSTVSCSSAGFFWCFPWCYGVSAAAYLNSLHGALREGR